MSFENKVSSDKTFIQRYKFYPGVQNVSTLFSYGIFGSISVFKLAPTLVVCRSTLYLFSEEETASRKTPRTFR